MSYIAPMIPDNAPFTAPQRAWLNGFIAAAWQGGAAAPSIDGVSAPIAVEAVAAEPEDHPWHDPTLSLDARMELAVGRPKAEVLMAAMAQLDCGQCGYLCQTYSRAIAEGAEASLTLCVPGGKETSRMLKEIVASDLVTAPPAAAKPAVSVAAPIAGRSLPVPGRLVAAKPLNGAASEKDTRHVVFRLEDANFTYEVGDSLGVHATNCPDMVEAVIEQLGAKPEAPVECPDRVTRPLREALLTACDIARPADLAIEVLASRARDSLDADRLQALAEGYPGAEPQDADLLDLLLAFPSARPPLQELVSSLGALQPRLYSIASSPKAHAGEVHLTVAAVRYERRRRARKGVASTFLADRLGPGEAAPIFVQTSHGFRLPEDPTTPVIMIGPGTGVAPFRAFLEERRATGAKGRNWLFFGDQRRASDFLYADEFEAYRRDGHLTRLDLAFSRDQAEKLYVQQRMRENAAELWAWLQEGAAVYVCGDASRMARDVDMALAFIVAKQGGMESGKAKAYLAELAKSGRYRRDVY